MPTKRSRRSPVRRSATSSRSAAPAPAPPARLRAARLLTQREAAQELNLSTRQVNRLVDEGLPTQNDRGVVRYAFPACTHWYIQRLRDLAKARHHGDESRQELERRKLEAQARLAEMDVAERERRLLPIDYIEHQLTLCLERLRAKMLNFPGQWAPHLVGCKTAAESQAKLQMAIAEAMQALSETGEDPELDADDDQDPA
jgi:phage terminase Nu1 subunit (DNA packaging protein)